MMKILPTPKQTGKTFTYQVTTNHSILVFIVIASHQERNRQVTSKGTGFGRISYWNTDISNPLRFPTGAPIQGTLGNRLLAYQILESPHRRKAHYLVIC